MDKNLMILNSEELTIDSREIAEMMDTEHSEILKKLEGTKRPNGSVKQVGIIPTMSKGKIPVADYFVKSSYIDAQGKERPCYLFTKMGCEFIANKFTGEKGILFTAKYVNKFNQMEKSIKDTQLMLANEKIERLEASMDRFERLTEAAKQQYKPSHKTKLDYNKMIKSLTNNDEEVQIVKDWVFGLLNIEKWEDTCVDDSKKIIETITTVARLLTIKKFEQLRLF